ncbi:unnamed protein product [Moneuplotes crassus]|uniref:Uncharacterized protein n=1 Tax=Euplotes crassus TaxID=5936 RepID=A0AAD1X6C1_EUPCR|nr:unnamed protein product [Moneuplotes crassus]
MESILIYTLSLDSSNKVLLSILITLLLSQIFGASISYFEGISEQKLSAYLFSLKEDWVAHLLISQ